MERIQNKFDDNGNESPVGINGHGFTASWDEHPDRDEEWQKVEVGLLVKKDLDVSMVANLVRDETLIQQYKTCKYDRY